MIAVSDPAGTQLRQCRLLVVGSGGRDRRRDESIDRGEGRIAGRAQIAVLRLLLQQRRIRRTLRRRDLQDREEDLRSGFPLPRPLRKGSATTMTTTKEPETTPTDKLSHT